MKKRYLYSRVFIVAENDDGKLIGQIVFYKINITTSDNIYTELLLSPISVHPDFFRKVDCSCNDVTSGIGTFSHVPRIFTRPEVVIFTMYSE